MRLYFTLKMALNALRHNVMRAALTTLGIIIGVAAVITMMEIGKGASLAIQRAMASIGANTVVVLPGSINVAGVATGSGSKVTLTPQDADAILKMSLSRLGGAGCSRPRPGSVQQSKLGADLCLRHYPPVSRHT